MKNFPLFLLAIAGCVSAVSCNNDDDGNNTNTNADIVGTYRMTGQNSPVAIDYDGDGDSSMNMMTESQCYNNTVMTVNADGTYTSTYNGVGITNGASSCATSQMTSGTWQRTGNSFTTTTTNGGTGANNWTWNGSNGTMTRTQANTQYPSINATTGDFEYAMGNVGYTYTLQ